MSSLFNKVVELKRFLVIDTHYLIGGRLQTLFNSWQWSGYLNMEREFWSIELTSILEFPDFKLIFVKCGCNNVSDVRVYWSTFADNQLWWVLEFNNWTDSLMAISVCIQILYYLLLFNVPNFYLAALCPNSDKVFIYLELGSRIAIVFELVIEYSSTRFQVNIANYCETFCVVCNAKNCAWTLNGAFPLELNHRVFFWRDWSSNKLGSNGAHYLLFLLLRFFFFFRLLWLLFFNLVSIFVNCFLFFHYNDGLNFNRRRLQVS